jgi:CO/xanthine dehydrogenase FAD-binding subunit
MRPFSYSRADSVQAAIGAQAPSELPPDAATVHAPNQFVAGGTTLIDLMKLDVMRPRNIIDINALERTPSGDIEFVPRGLHLGALVRMSAAEHADVRANYPVIAQSLELAASQQIRNMASLGGNVVQRAVRISGTHRTAHATSASQARVAPRWEGSIDHMPFSAPAITASRPMPAILPRRSLR